MGFVGWELTEDCYPWMISIHNVLFLQILRSGQCTGIKIKICGYVRIIED